MIKSNSTKIYDTYLAEWKDKKQNVVQPEFISQFAPKYLELCDFMIGISETDHQGKCLRPSKVVVLKDGRAVERGFDGRGCNLYAVYPTLEDALNFDKPTSYNEYFGRW